MPPPSRIFPKVSKLRAINHPPAAKVDFRNGKPLPKRSAAPPQLAPQPYPVYPSGASGAYGPSLARRRLFPHLRDAFASFRQRCRSLPQPIQLSFRTFVLMLPAIPIGLFIHENVFRLVKVNGPSMTPYLNEDYDLMHTRADTVLVKLWSKHQWIPWKDGRRIERGMVVIFRSPANPFRLAVKRIVGLPGDRVTHRDFPENDSYLVPWNHIWVEGDAADPHRSMDSNTYGPISISLIEGVVVAVLGPRMRWLDWKSWESGDVDDAGPNGRLGPNYRQSMRNRVLKDAVKLERPPEW